MTHITIAVALIGAAVTLGLAIWESQKGKTQGPAIIDKRSHADASACSAAISTLSGCHGLGR
jgi:hypothetical protein